MGPQAATHVGGRVKVFRNTPVFIARLCVAGVTVGWLLNDWSTVTTHPLDRLSGHLGRPAADVPAIAALADEDKSRLADLIGEAFALQDSKIDAALERTAGSLPKLLRGKVTKLLFPEGNR